MSAPAQETAAEPEQNGSLSPAHAHCIKCGDLQHTVTSCPELEANGHEATPQASSFQFPLTQAPLGTQNFQYVPQPEPPTFARYHNPLDLIDDLIKYGQLMEEWAQGFQAFIGGDIRTLVQAYPYPHFFLGENGFRVEFRRVLIPAPRPGNTYLSQARGLSSIPAAFQNPQNANPGYGGRVNDWLADNSGRRLAEPLNYSPHVASQQAFSQTGINADESPLPAVATRIVDGHPRLIIPPNPNMVASNVGQLAPARPRKPRTPRTKVATDSPTPSGSGTVAPKPPRARAITTTTSARASRVTKPRAPRKSRVKSAAALSSEQTVQQEESGEGQAVGDGRLEVQAGIAGDEADAEGEEVASDTNA